MDIYGTTHLHINDIDTATEHFSKHDKCLHINPGAGGHFDYQKRICLLGQSFVSVSSSRSGWGYKTSDEIDGFVITLPHAGHLQWRTPTGTHNVGPGDVALVDQREVFSATYATGVSYTTVYVEQADLFKYATLILGCPLKARVHFHNNAGGACKIACIRKLVDTILHLSSHSLCPFMHVGESLKEALVGFLIYNFPNNYSRMLCDDRFAPTPTPHSINRAAELMAANVDPNLTVCEIAAFAGLSVRSLQTGFRRFKNMTPIAFLRLERLHKAQSILRDLDNRHDPKEVARLCGFPNYQAFCKYFCHAFNEHPVNTYLKTQRR